MTPSAARVVALVPAAGAARRFGSAKLLVDLRGEPLLQHTLRCVLDAHVSEVVLVVAPGQTFDTVPLTRDRRVVLVTNVDPDRGMFSSILTGLASVALDCAVLVLPADMPFVRADTAAKLVVTHARYGDAVVASYGGTRGHPLILSASVWPKLLEQPPETNLKAALGATGAVLRELRVDDPGVLRDVDVPGDLDA
jgi:molybdenum cofactor cytidylyltransferase